jgi:hypothetical protein
VIFSQVHNVAGCNISHAFRGTLGSFPDPNQLLLEPLLHREISCMPGMQHHQQPLKH